MRALSHYWRVTPQDNVVAQALLEKAIGMDRNYGQALGLLADSYTFGAHMGWTDLTTAVQIAERAALAAVLADSADPWAHHALGGVYLITRRFDSSSLRVRAITSRMASSIATASFCAGTFLMSARMRPMTSLARLPSFMIPTSASLTSPKSGGSALIQRRAACAFVTAAGIGWFTSWVIEAVNRPIVATRFMWPKSDCICSNLPSPRVRSSMSASPPDPPAHR